MDARRAVGVPTLLVDLRALGGDLPIRSGARWDPAARPGVVAGARDAEHPTRERRGVGGLLRLDEPLAAHRVSCAKTAAALRRIARAWRST